MTGGAGFARQGQDSFRDNRKLRNRRGSLTDNPYTAANSPVGDRDPAAAGEARDWMSEKHLKVRNLRRIIFWLILPLLLLLSIIVSLF